MGNGEREQGGGEGRKGGMERGRKDVNTICCQIHEHQSCPLV